MKISYRSVGRAVARFYPSCNCASDVCLNFKHFAGSHEVGHKQAWHPCIKNDSGWGLNSMDSYVRKLGLWQEPGHLGIKIAFSCSSGDHL